MLSAAPRLAQQLSRYGIGGSEIAAACGFSRYRSRFGLWLEKTGRAPGFAGNIHTRLGQLCEPRIRQLYANSTGLDILIPPASLFHPECDHERATPDGINAADARHLAQIKAIGYFVGRRWQNEIPIEVEAQCQWEMHVAGADRNDLVVGIGSDELEWERFLFGEIVDPAEVLANLTVEIWPQWRRDADIATLRAGAAAFWSMVERDEQPPIDDSEACRDFLNGRPAKPIVLEYEDHQDIADEFRDAYRAKQAADKRLELAKNHVRGVLGDIGANRIKTPDGPVLWTKNKQLRAPDAWGKPEEH